MFWAKFIQRDGGDDDLRVVALLGGCGDARRRVISRELGAKGSTKKAEGVMNGGRTMLSHGWLDNAANRWKFRIEDGNVRKEDHDRIIFSFDRSKWALLVVVADELPP